MGGEITKLDKERFSKRIKYLINRDNRRKIRRK